MADKDKTKEAPPVAVAVVFDEVFQKHFHNSPTFSQNVDIANQLQEFKQDFLARLKEV